MGPSPGPNVLQVYAMSDTTIKVIFDRALDQTTAEDENNYDLATMTNIKLATLDVGGDLAMPVTDDYPEGEKNKFQGAVNWVRIDLEEDDVSHLESEDNKYHRIMARQ